MISSSFARVVQINIDYWCQRTAQITETQMHQLNTDYPNLVRAVQQGLTLPETQSVKTAELIKQSFLLVERYGRWQTWLPLLEKAAVSCINSSNSSLIQFELLNQQGQLQRLNRQLDAAIHSHNQAKIIAHNLNHQAALAKANFNLSEDYRHQHRYEEAEKYGLEALSLFKSLQNKEGTAATLNTLGLIALEQGSQSDLARAEDRLRQAIAVGQSVNSDTLLARTHISLAIALKKQEKFAEALAIYQKADKLLATTESEIDKSRLQNCLGTLYFAWQRWREAEIHFRQADSRILQESGDTYVQAALIHNIGNVILKQGRPGEAEDYFRRGNGLWRQANDSLCLANGLGALGESLAQQGRNREAVTYFDQAIALLHQLPNQTEDVKRLLNEFTKEREKCIEKRPARLGQASQAF